MTQQVSEKYIKALRSLAPDVENTSKKEEKSLRLTPGVAKILAKARKRKNV